MNPGIAAIRNAFASGEFPLAHRLWTVYAERLDQEIHAGTASQAMLAETRELVDWSRLLVQAFQAHARDRIASRSVAQRYSESSVTTRHSLRTSL